MTGATDPFSASIIPFEVPEQVRAFAEKGVSQARENYAKFKDAAETHNGTIEAVFTSAQQGRERVLRQADGIHEGQHHGQSRLRPGAVRREVAVATPWSCGPRHAKTQLETFQAQAKELAEIAQQAATDDRRADQGHRLEVLHAGRLMPVRS